MSRRDVLLRRSVLQLYKNLVTVIKKWPTDPERKGRNLSEYMQQKVRLEFSKNKDLKNPQEIKKLLEKGESELVYLVKLLNDSYRSAYSRTDYGLPVQAMKGQHKLSSEYLAKSQFGVVKKFFRWITGRSSDTEHVNIVKYYLENRKQGSNK